jgi:hypothetical protein
MRRAMSPILPRGPVERAMIPDDDLGCVARWLRQSAMTKPGALAVEFKRLRTDVAVMPFSL